VNRDGRLDELVNNAGINIRKEAKDNIQVNAVLPGGIDADLTRDARQAIEGLNERVLARSPSGRWGSIADFEGIAVDDGYSSFGRISFDTLAVPQSSPA
jgi:NAD(P)-dependent dehydrogenase (short-subunit alcohol dehydrogenase family)